VKQLIDAGFTEKLFLANDWYFGVTIAGTGAMDVMDKLNPDGMLFVTRKTIPYLKQLGVTDAQSVVHHSSSRSPRSPRSSTVSSRSPG